jgi:hypothetical protein
MRLAPLLLIALLAAAAPAAASPQENAQGATAPTTAPAPVSRPAASPPPIEEPYPQFGLQFAVGAPDGAVLSFVYSPWYWLLLDAGFAYTLAPGFVLGVEFRPIDFFVSPIIRGEYGYYFAGNTADQIKKWSGLPEASWPLIGDASYNWFSGLLGIALGSRRGFTCTLEGGVGWLSLNVKGGSGTIDNGQITTADWKAQSFMPVARLSFLLFF